ncbi:MAG: single-stranded-DNA-specific exonuclease RecJ [Thiobacillus sp.]
MPQIRTRPYSSDIAQTLEQQGFSPAWARLYAARGVTHSDEVCHRLQKLIAPEGLLNIDHAATLLANAIAARQRLLIVADYDADGATGCAVGVKGLRMLGAQVDYLVPNRLEHGYGLTPEIVRLAAARQPDLMITVDNGIAAVEGVAEASRLGIPVLITDHHLPGDALPDAACIVNPNQSNCSFASKNLAGVGVMFYVLLAVRAEQRRRGMYAHTSEPDLRALLDLVALGTVADVVRLDANNRTLVAQGLARMRAGKAAPGINALFHAAGADPMCASVFDLGFKLGPRLNAAGRIDDMALGIECLLADEATAPAIAQRLNTLNVERRDIESNMQDEALAALADFNPDDCTGLTAYQPRWHIGVIGILASRLKDKFHRPTVVFARHADGELKGSGRSISGLHLRDALDLIAKRHPGLILKFGGHAMAAGLSIPETRYAEFKMAFDAITRELLTVADLEGLLETDGELALDEHNYAFAQQLEHAIWGQAFPSPLFIGDFQVQQQRVLKDKHLKLILVRDEQRFDAMHFFHPQLLPERIRAVYALMTNEYNGSQTLQLRLQHWEARI